MSSGEINVDQVMYDIKETVARQRRAPLSSLGNLHQTKNVTAAELPAAQSILQTPFRPRNDNHYDITDLLKYHHRDFVVNAYRALLKREPDQTGLAQYLDQFASGRINKIDVLASIRFSAEGRRVGVKVDGLVFPALVRYIERLPVIGYLIQIAIASVRLPRLHQHLRQLEFHILAQQQRIVEHYDEIHKRFSESLHNDAARMLTIEQTATDLAQTTAQWQETATQWQETAAQRQEIAEKQLKDETEQRVRVDQELQGLVSEQQQSINRVADEAEELLRRYRQMQSELGVHERRLALLLETVREYKPLVFDRSLKVQAPTKEDERLDALYASFEDRFRGEREEIKERLRVYLPIVRDAKITEDVLELGSGRGEWLEILKEAGIRARGVEHNRVQAERCTASGLEVIQEDVLAYLEGLEDQSLNALTSFHLIEHLHFYELLKLLDESARTLRPGGLIILETPNPENFIVGSYAFYTDPTHVRPIPSPTLEFLLAARGFAGIEVLKLRPAKGAELAGNSEIIKRFNEYFCSAADYGIIGRKV